MKKIDGYVCVSTIKGTGSLFLFGKRIDPTLPHNYENIQSNGYILFETEEEALESKNSLDQRFDITLTRLAKLKMNISESERDFNKIAKMSNWIVIGHMDCDQLFGDFVDGKSSASPLPGAYLRSNGLKTFDDFNDVDYMAQEVCRQGACRISIATFNLEYLINEKNEGN